MGVILDKLMHIMSVDSGINKPRVCELSRSLYRIGSVLLFESYGVGCTY